MGRRAIETFDGVRRYFTMAAGKSGLSDVDVRNALGHIKEACGQVEDDGSVVPLRAAAVAATERFLMTRCWNANILSLTRPIDEGKRTAAEQACGRLREALERLPTDAASRAVLLE